MKDQINCALKIVYSVEGFEHQCIVCGAERPHNALCHPLDTDLEEPRYAPLCDDCLANTIEMIADGAPGKGRRVVASMKRQTADWKPGDAPRESASIIDPITGDVNDLAGDEARDMIAEEKAQSSRIRAAAAAAGIAAAYLN